MFKVKITIAEIMSDKNEFVLHVYDADRPVVETMKKLYDQPYVREFDPEIVIEVLT